MAANLPPEPLSSETAALRGFHDLLGRLPDSNGWDGPAEIGDDPAVPALPMPEIALCPDAMRIAMKATCARVVDPVARAAKAAARAEAAALHAEMAQEETRSKILARIERCPVIDAYGRTWGIEYR